MTKTPDETKTETTEQKRARLLAELEALPDSPAPKAGHPGTIVGEGLAADKVEYTEAWYLDIEARRKDTVPGHPNELMWPNYQLHEVISQEDLPVGVNGVFFRVIPGIPCRLPTPHYAVYKDAIERRRELGRKYAPPENPVRQAGYVSPVHRMGTGWSKTSAEQPK